MSATLLHITYDVGRARSIDEDLSTSGLIRDAEAAVPRPR
jgi:hypothetical protein